MAYVFPKKLRNGNDKPYKVDIRILTRSDRNDSASGFCNALANIKAEDFDNIAAETCEVRIQYLSSVDAFIKASNGDYYFIEFKNDTQARLDALPFDKGRPIDSRTQRPVTCSQIELSLKHKAFDSLCIAGMTTLRDVPGKEIMDHAVLIVVRRDDKSKSFDKITNILSSFSTGGRPVLWGLDELRKSGFYKEVHTWTESEFVAKAPRLLK